VSSTFGGLHVSFVSNAHGCHMNMLAVVKY